MLVSVSVFTGCNRQAMGGTGHRDLQEPDFVVVVACLFAMFPCTSEARCMSIQGAPIRHVPSAVLEDQGLKFASAFSSCMARTFINAVCSVRYQSCLLVGRS